MGEKAVLVTGACGEIGQALIQNLSAHGGYRIVSADLMPLPESVKALSAE
ncbi:MAG: epimerase, partial [Chloroflexi bacterium]